MFEHGILNTRNDSCASVVSSIAQPGLRVRLGIPASHARSSDRAVATTLGNPSAELEPVTGGQGLHLSFLMPSCGATACVSDMLKRDRRLDAAARSIALAFGIGEDWLDLVSAGILNITAL